MPEFFQYEDLKKHIKAQISDTFIPLHQMPLEKIFSELIVTVFKVALFSLTFGLIALCLPKSQSQLVISYIEEFLQLGLATFLLYWMTLFYGITLLTYRYGPIFESSRWIFGLISKLSFSILSIVLGVMVGLIFPQHLGGNENAASKQSILAFKYLIILFIHIVSVKSISDPVCLYLNSIQSDKFKHNFHVSRLIFGASCIGTSFLVLFSKM